MSCSQESLEHIYRQSLEQSIIEDIASEKKIELRLATVPSPQVLARDLIENESEIFPA